MSRFAFLVVLVVLAGCMGASGGPKGQVFTTTTPSSSSAPVGSVTVSPSDDGATNGRIEGSVTDQELRPIESASVLLAGLDARVSTTADGSFAFSNVPVGTYPLEVHAAGHEAQAKKADVAADEVTEVRFTLVAIPMDEPRHHTLMENGRILCNFACDQPIFELLLPVAVHPEWEHRVEGGWNTTVLEFDWTPNLSLGLKWLQIQVSTYSTESGATNRSHMFHQSQRPWRSELHENQKWHYSTSSALGPPYTGNATAFPPGPVNFKYFAQTGFGTGYGGLVPPEPQIVIDQTWNGYATLFYGDPPPTDFSALSQE